MSSSMESLFPFKACSTVAPTSKNFIESNDSVQKMSCCSQCLANYEQELAFMEEEKVTQMPSVHQQSRQVDQGQQALPLWLQIAKSASCVKRPDMLQTKDQEPVWSHRVEEIKKKWNDNCRSLHPHFHAIRPIFSMERSQELTRFPNQAIDANVRRQRECTVDKPGVQDPHRNGKVFPRTLDTLWRPAVQPKCVMPILTQGTGAIVQGNSRTLATQISEDNCEQIIQNALGASLGELPSSLPGSCHAGTPPVSPVRTDLALGRPDMLSPSRNMSNVPDKSMVIESHKERLQDLVGCMPSDFGLTWPISRKLSTPCTEAGSVLSAQHLLDQQNGKYSGLYRQIDADAFKRLCKGIQEKVGWQCEAVSTVANAVLQCRSGNGKRRIVGVKRDTWLLFLGPDRVGKRKIASALSELIFGSEKKLICMRLSSQDGVIPSTWNLGQHEQEEYGVNYRGKTALDRVAEAVRQNPFSVVLLEEVDQADSLIHRNLIQAMEKGRLLDSHGREVGLGNAIFVMTANTGMEIPKRDARFSEEKLAAACGWPMQLIVESARFEVLISKCTKVSVIDYAHETETKDNEQVPMGLGFGSKRKAEWIKDDQAENNTVENVKKLIKEPVVSLDLNLSIEENEITDFATASHGHTEACQGSRDSSDLTVEQSHKCAGELFKDLSDSVDEIVLFKPLESLADRIVESIGAKFFSIIGSEGLIEIDVKAVEQILAVWFSPDGLKTFENWVEQVLSCSLMEVRTTCTISADTIVKLVVEKELFSGERPPGICLPSTISVNRRTKAFQKAGAI